MADNEELDPPPPQDISNVFTAADYVFFFAAVDLLSCSSSDSYKYKRACIKSKVIRYSILYSGEFPDPCSR